MMSFTFETERITAISSEGIPMGYITFPQVRPGLAAISQVMVFPRFRNQGVAESMMEALLVHLDENQQNAALTCPFAQQYMAVHPQWKHLLPGKIHFTTH